jgi:hypothetical protein
MRKKKDQEEDDDDHQHDKKKVMMSPIRSQINFLAWMRGSLMRMRVV